MSRMPKLNDLQLILLATAVQREDGSILPPSETIGDQAERIHKAIPLLLKHTLVAELPVTDQTRAWRHEDQQPMGLAITAAGRAIIAAEEEAPDEGSANGPGTTPAIGVAASPTPTPSAPRAGSKIDTVIGLLRRDEGATLAMLVESTGWLPHTTRAALTGLRKKGHMIGKTSREGATVYQIAEAV